MKKDTVLNITLTRQAERVCLSINDHTVTLKLPDSDLASMSYDNALVAAGVFEANIKGFEEQGYTYNSFSENTLPGILTFLDQTRNDCIIRFYEEDIQQVYIVDDDPLGIWDLEYSWLKKALPFGYFNPDKANPEIFGIHSLRRFVSHPASATCKELGLRLGINVNNVLTFLANSDRADRLTHLEILEDRDNKSIVLSHSLSAQFLRLKRLYIEQSGFQKFIFGIFPQLELLEFHNFYCFNVPNVSMEDCVKQMLDQLRYSTPILKTLSFLNNDFGSTELEILAKHPFILQLEVLDLYNNRSYYSHKHRVNINTFNYEGLLQLEPFFRHLKKVIISDYLVTKEIKDAFSTWPNILFISLERSKSPS